MSMKIDEDDTLFAAWNGTGTRCKYFSGDGGNRCQLLAEHGGAHSFCRQPSERPG